MAGYGKCPVLTGASDLVKQQGYDLSDQVHVITGGDSGVGEGLVKALALARARVILLAHNVKKTEKLLPGIINSTGNAKLSVIPVDLLSFASVRAAAAAVLEQADHIHGISCNAGTGLESHMTEDGFESTFQRTYISHFLLVQLLLPKLRESHGRVVLISTDGITPYGPDGDCNGNGMGERCTSIDNLKQAVRKTGGSEFLALFLKSMLARELARREADNGITAYSFHPGLVLTPGVKAGYFSSGYGKEQALKDCGQGEFYGCLCRGPDSKTCGELLNEDQGAVAALYDLAAPTHELAHANGAMTVLCGYVPPGPRFDPFISMEGKIGLDATRTYTKQLYDLSSMWVSDGGIRRNKFIKPSAYTSLQ